MPIVSILAGVQQAARPPHHLRDKQPTKGGIMDRKHLFLHIAVLCGVLGGTLGDAAGAAANKPKNGYIRNSQRVIISSGLAI